MAEAHSLLQAARDSGFDHVGLLETFSIRFHEDVRKACERNACGKYDTNWMGPPAIGTITELKEQVLRFRQGLLLQTVHRMNGSFNFKGMMAAAKEHQAMFRKFLAELKRIYPADSFLPLDAGCCSHCEKCAYQDSQPCRCPDQALSSVEAYGMDVSTLMKTVGIPYNHGKAAIGFVGLILFDRQDISQ